MVLDFVPFHICLQLQIFRGIDTNIAKIDQAVFDLPLDGIRIDEQHKNEHNARSASPGVPSLSLTMYPFSIPSLILTTHSE